MRVQGQVIQRCVLALGVALAAAPGGVRAEAPGDAYWIELAAFAPTISSTARLDATSTSRPGSSIKLEDELDLSDREVTPYFSLGTRLGENWRIEFEYYKLARSARTTLSREIDWGDTTFPLGAEIRSRFDTTVYRLIGGYSFLESPTSEAGVSFGLHVTDFATALSGQGTGPGGVSFRTEGNNTLVPLPTLGLYGSVQVANGVHLRGRVDYLSLEYDEYDGSLINSLAAVDWRFAKNWGAGIGYRYVDYKLNVTKREFYGEVNYRFKGPTLFLNAAF
jgi:hypothetical protein